MAKFRAYATVSAGKYLGIVEAATAEEAEGKAWELDECGVSVCHQCSHEVDGPEIASISIEPADESEPVGPPKRRW